MTLPAQLNELGVTMNAGEASNEVLKVLPSAPVEVRTGGTAEARVTVLVKDGYHVQANPASGDFLVPLRLELRTREGVRPGRPIYPPGQAYRLPGMESDWMTYEGRVEIVVPLVVDASARSGPRSLAGVLHYQACDARTCLFPASVPISLTVKVVGAPAVGLDSPAH